MNSVGEIAAASRPESGGLIALIDRLSEARVGVVGDLVADIYVSGQSDRVSREAPVIIIEQENEWLVPGGAANVAANIAALAAQTHVVGLIGGDETGRTLQDRLLAAGAQVDGIVAEKNRSTVSKTRFLAGAKHTNRQQVLRVDRPTSGPTTEQTRRELRRRIEQADPAVDVWIASDYGCRMFDRALLGLLREIAKDKTVIADSRFQLADFAGMTVLKPNEQEALLAAADFDAKENDVPEAARTLLEALKVEAVLVTLGNQGMLLHQQTSAEHIPTVGGDEIVDLTGAGDTVAAILASAMSVGGSLSQAAYLANCAGGLVVMKEGAASINIPELKAAATKETSA
jgi:rfaE bifunctional protein kinase chain/domain